MGIEGKLTRLKEIAIAFSVWLAVPALFALTVYSIWLDRAPSAAVAGAFTLAFVILMQLPLVESFKIFTLEAKFARRVDEAERLLEGIRSTAEVHSRMLYWQVGKGDRMSEMPWALKRSLVEETDKLLGGLGLSEANITALKFPFFHTIKLDLFRVYERTVDYRIRQSRDEIQQKLSAFPKPIQAGDPEYAAVMMAWQNTKLPFDTHQDIMDDGRLDNMAAITLKLITDTPLPEADKQVLEQVRMEVVQLAEACDRAGNITPETEDYLRRYSRNPKTRAQELFGEV
jgi:hypothetical protein